MGIKKFNDFINESDQSEEIKKALELLRNSGYHIEKIEPEKVTKIGTYQAPTFDTLMLIPKFSELQKIFELEEVRKLDPKKYRGNKKNLYFFPGVMENKGGSVPLFNLSSPKENMIRLSFGNGRPEVSDILSFTGRPIISNAFFNTAREKNAVVEIIEKYLYLIYIGLWKEDIKKITEKDPGSMDLVIKAYGESKVPADELSEKSLMYTLNLIDSFDIKSFAREIKKIPENKSMNIITAVLDTPRISHILSNYLEKNHDLFKK